MWLVDSLVIPASLREDERSVARPPFHRAVASGSTRDCRGAVPPRCGARRADRLRDCLRRCERPSAWRAPAAPPASLRRCDRRRSHSRVRSPPTAVRRDRPSTSTATDASPTRGSRPDRLRPVDSRDRDTADYLARDRPQPSAEPLFRAQCAHPARGDRGGSAARAPCSAGAGSSAAGPGRPLATARPASASTPVGGRSRRVAPARPRTRALRMERS